MSDNWVYFIQGIDGGPIKIGIAKNVQARLDALKTGLPFKLVVLASRPGDHALEQSLHKKHSKHRLQGEWFAPHAEVLDEIAAARVCEQAPLRRRIYKQPVSQQKRDFTNFVRATFPAVLRKTGLTCPQIARQAGVPFETAKSWWRGKALPRGYVLINLARANSLVSAWMDLCAGKYEGDPETQAIADRMIGRLERT